MPTTFNVKICLSIDSLLKRKILDRSKLKALNFADDKINVTEKLNFVLESVENIVRKG